MMETHSLVLLSGSTLDHTHLHNSHARRAQPVPLCGSRRQPLRNLAQGLVRLLPQLRRQLTQRLRRAPTRNDNELVRTWPTSAVTDGPSTSVPMHSAATMQTALHQPRHRFWRKGHRGQHVKPQGHRVPHIARHPHHDQGLPHQDAQSCGQELGPPSEQPAPLVLMSPLEVTLPPQPQRSPLQCLARAWQCLGAQMRPEGPGENDKNIPERILNVATCGMFFQAGAKIIRLCRSVAARRFGWAFVVVGVIATVYHGSWGHWRSVARKVDYYSIAVSSLLLRSAVVGAVPKWLTAFMLMAIPFKPTLVSTSNFMAVEVRYMLLALTQRHLLSKWAAHTGLSVAATVCFTLEDAPLLSWCPYTHAAFHALSAAAFLTLPSALNYITKETPTACGV